jgi:leader peptidase (prepilin peptidase)/N-methyltransferase
MYQIFFSSYFHQSYPFFDKTQLILWTCFLFFVGLCVGSFLNVCIWRIPRNESIIFPPSHCPNCNYEIAWYENIPVISWLLLKGRCRKCASPISPRYIIVEIITGVLFLGVWFKILSFNMPFKFFIPLLVSSLAVTVLALLTAFIDYEHLIIPNKITYPVILGGIAAAPFFNYMWGCSTPWKALTAVCASVSICIVILFTLAFIGKLIFKKDAFGWGDIKYMAAVSAAFGPVAAFFILFAASLIGAFAGIVMIILKRKKFTGLLPFGVCLAIASYLWIIWGREAVELYWSMTAFDKY